MKIMKDSERMRYILDEIGLSQTDFSLILGVPNQKISDIRRGWIKKIPSDIAVAITKKYPQFNLEWILTGEGEMLNTDSTIAVESDKVNSSENLEIKNLKEQILILNSHISTLQKIIDKLIEK